MTSLVTVLIPVLGRPARVGPLIDNLLASAGAAALSPKFLCSPDDTAEITAVRTSGADYLIVPWPQGPGDYAKKINYGFADEAALGVEWMLIGGDDLYFHTGWADAALRVHEETEACVIGTNDLGNPRVKAGHHSTHPLVHRDYRECGTVDDTSVLLHPGYSHNFVDVEFVETAQWRGTYAHAHDAIVEHMHPVWHKGEHDSTYEIGRTDWKIDQRLYGTRRRLWAARY